MTLPSVDRGAQRQDTTRDRLLQAAQAAFLERGHTQATTRNIADRAGLTERTLFNLFPTKGDLFRDAVAAAVSELDEGRVRDMVEVHELAAAAEPGRLSGFVRRNDRPAPPTIRPVRGGHSPGRRR